MGEVAEQVQRLIDEADCVEERVVSELAGRKLSTLADWRKRDVGPPWVRCGGRVLYPRAALLAWMLKRQRGEKAVAATGEAG